MNELLEVAFLPGKGRGYRALTDIPAGATIHVSEPLATTVSQEWTPETCIGCFDFVYPKKQKIRAVNEQEQIILLQQWSLPKAKKNSPSLFKDFLFCSQDCKSKLQAHGYQSTEWMTTLAVNYRLDLEFRNSKTYEINVPGVQTLMDHVDWIDINNDDDLNSWLNHAWDYLTEDLDLYREIQDSDRSMCRLIASCILRKNGEKDANIQVTSIAAAAQLPQFKDLLVIQNNELSHFKSHFNHSLNKLPMHHNKEMYLSIIPAEILDVMALYSFFERAVCQTQDTIPILSHVDHHVFRSIFFRERANSFGLWEMGDDEIVKGFGGVSDDLELLGFGIYPSAVYFNHSCDANVIKVRDGKSMKFIARRMINKNEEACISYGSVDEDVHSRRKRLLEHYHFLCHCTKCVDDDLYSTNR